MYCLKRSITYLDGTTENIETCYKDLGELQSVMHRCLVGEKSVVELVITLVEKE